jgi:hypothetical protein
MGRKTSTKTQGRGKTTAERASLDVGESSDTENRQPMRSGSHDAYFSLINASP